MKKTTSDDIHAFVDGELSTEDTKRIRKFLETSPAGRELHDKVALQKFLLKEWWKAYGVTRH